MQPERSNQEASSGAGELSDSVSVAEVGVSVIKKKKSRVKTSSAATPLASHHLIEFIYSSKGTIILSYNDNSSLISTIKIQHAFASNRFVFQSKVRVRRASISEPSDTDYESRLLSSTEGGF